MERFPSLRYIREAYGLNECGIITLTYPREKKNSVPGGLKAIDLPDDHVMPVGWTNMYSQIKIINRYLCIFIFFNSLNAQIGHTSNFSNFAKMYEIRALFIESFVI